MHPEQERMTFDVVHSYKPFIGKVFIFTSDKRVTPRPESVKVHNGTTFVLCGASYFSYRPDLVRFKLLVGSQVCTIDVHSSYFQKGNTCHESEWFKELLT